MTATLWQIIWILIGYFAFVWIILRLIVPDLGFKRKPVCDIFPDELNEKITELNSVARDDMDFLHRTYDFVTTRYHGSRIKTVTQFWRAFGDHYKRPGFLPCNGQNCLIRMMLVKSGRFTEDDIEIVVTPLNFFIHQYIKVKVSNSWITVDPWSHFLGKRIGQKSAFFS